MALAVLLATNTTYLQHEHARTGTNCRDKCSQLWGVQLSGPGPSPVYLNLCWQSYTHTHTPCSDLTRGKVPASPHSHSSKIHKGKVLNDFLSLPVFTACCPHPPCLLPLRQRKSGRITAEVAAGFQCVYVCVCERVCVFALLDVPLCADTVVGHVQEGKRALMESFLSMLYQKHEEPPCWERSQAPAPPLPAPLFPSCTPSAALCLPPQPLSPVRRDSFHTGSKTSSFRAPVTVPKAHTICSPRSPSARACVCPFACRLTSRVV